MAEQVLDLVRKATPYLAMHGSASARLDAELLLAEVLSCGRMDLYLQFERPVLAEEVDRFRELCRRRALGEPVAYIRGRREFMSIELGVSPAVLVPRPETEVLVGEGLRRLAARAGNGPLEVLDIGTGSGAIALALVAARDDVSAVATDISEPALEVARANAARLNVADRVTFVAADLADGVPGRFDLVTANLPYIDPEWPDAVTAEVAASEPALALFAGRDGMDHIGRLIPRLGDLLKPGAVALLEIDPRQSGEVRAAASRATAGVDILLDLGARERVAVLTP